MSADRLKAIVLYVLHQVPGKCMGKHELFKILYFASQKHLVRYGDTMITDFYAFDYGPVPSALCNYLKGTDNVIVQSLDEDEETKYMLRPKEHPDMDELSKTDIWCLDESIEENHGCDFNSLTHKSHDSAWHKAWKNKAGKRGGKMNILDIAEAVGADEPTLECIREELELELAFR